MNRNLFATSKNIEDAKCPTSGPVVVDPPVNNITIECKDGWQIFSRIDDIIYQVTYNIPISLNYSYASIVDFQNPTAPSMPAEAGKYSITLSADRKTVIFKLNPAYHGTLNSTNKGIILQAVINPNSPGYVGRMTILAGTTMGNQGIRTACANGYDTPKF
ncbi:hypothetical protein ACQ9BO_08745 [Flavobacterium sp. P21]|uniref:hypothetical protein n=1 Tax=Flavobacterium sp. P21 TaxID=3423948 RepID=UPI003D6652B3